jgi:hypothetical protein
MVDWSRLTQAFYDMERRARDIPTRRENIEQIAMDNLKRKQAEANLGFTEARAAALPAAEERAAELHDARLRNYQSQISTREAPPDPKVRMPAAAGSVEQFAQAKERELGRPLTSDEILQVQTEWDKAQGSGDSSQWSGAVQGKEGIFYPRMGITMPYPEGFQPKGTDDRLVKVGQIVDVLGGLALKLNEGIDPSVSGRIKGAWMKMSAMLNLDPDAQVYGDSLAGAASQLAKAFGESGRLSDQDIQRTVNMFPRPGDSETVTRRKLEIINILVGRGIGDNPLPKGSAESLQAQAENKMLVDQFANELSGGYGTVEPGGGVLSGIPENPRAESPELGGAEFSPEDDALLKEYGY